jgi:hypothetical protein
MINYASKNTYANVLAALVKEPNLKQVVHVGHFTCGDEGACYIARHRTKHLAKAVLIGAVLLLMLKTVVKSSLLEQNHEPCNTSSIPVH